MLRIWNPPTAPLLSPIHRFCPSLSQRRRTRIWVAHVYVYGWHVFHEDLPNQPQDVFRLNIDWAFIALHSSEVKGTASLASPPITVPGSSCQTHWPLLSRRADMPPSRQGRTCQCDRKPEKVTRVCAIDVLNNLLVIQICALVDLMRFPHKQRAAARPVL